MNFSKLALGALGALIATAMARGAAKQFGNAALKDAVFLVVQVYVPVDSAVPIRVPAAPGATGTKMSDHEQFESRMKLGEVESFRRLVEKLAKTLGTKSKEPGDANLANFRAFGDDVPDAEGGS